MTNEILRLFNNIASAAMDRGLDLQLEQKEYFHDSKGIGPSILGGHTEDTGVVLRVYQPEKESEQDEEEDESND